MEDLLNHPAIQGGIAPFIIGLVISLVFMRFNLFAGLAVVAGFIGLVLLTTGFSFSPLTSMRKITLLILIAPVVALILQASGKFSDRILKLFYGLAGVAVIWLLWPLILRNPLGEMFFPVFSYAVYAAWMMGVFMRMSELPAATAGVTSMMTGFAIGGSAVIGASALIGQMGMTLAVTSAAFLVVQLIRQRDDVAGLTFTMTSGLMAALLLPAAIVFADVPWLVLPLVAMIPLIAIYPFEDEDNILKNTAFVIVRVAAPVGLAFYLTWQSAGALLL